MVPAIPNDPVNRRSLIVAEFHQGPGRSDRSGRERMTARILHENIGRQNELARDPTARGNCECRKKVAHLSPALFSPHQRADDVLQEECDHAFIASVCPITPAATWKTSPAGAEMERQRNTRNYSDCEVHFENTRPKLRRIAMRGAAGPQLQPSPAIMTKRFP